MPPIVAIVPPRLVQGIVLACDEECAPGFVFDGALATCIRAATS